MLQEYSNEFGSHLSTICLVRGGATMMTCKQPLGVLEVCDWVVGIHYWKSNGGDSVGARLTCAHGCHNWHWFLTHLSTSSGICHYVGSLTSNLGK